MSVVGHGERVSDYRGPYTMTLNEVRKTSFTVWQFGENGSHVNSVEERTIIGK